MEAPEGETPLQDLSQDELKSMAEVLYRTGKFIRAKACFVRLLELESDADAKEEIEKKLKQIEAMRASRTLATALGGKLYVPHNRGIIVIMIVIAIVGVGSGMLAAGSGGLILEGWMAWTIAGASALIFGFLLVVVVSALRRRAARRKDLG